MIPKLLVSEQEFNMDLVSSIAMFGYTVVIGIVLLIIWENIRSK